MSMEGDDLGSTVAVSSANQPYLASLAHGTVRFGKKPMYERKSPGYIWIASTVDRYSEATSLRPDVGD